MRKFGLLANRPTPQHDALVFLAFTLDEQLYDLTDDSYKAPALNSFSRTLELQSIAKANHIAGIGKDALKPFVEELAWSVARDPSLSIQQRALCKVHIDNITSNLSDPDRISRGVAGLRIVFGDHFNNIILALKKTITEKPGNKSDIVALSSNFIIQAELLGFPRRHTYYAVQGALIRTLKHKITLDPEKVLDDFFDQFPPKKTKFDCIFLIEGQVKKFEQLLSAFQLQILDSAPEWEGLSNDQQLFLRSKSDVQTYLLVKGISARSPAQAHKIATDMMEEFSGVVRFHEHKLEFSPSSLSLVRDATVKRVYRVRDALDPMHCRISNIAATEGDMLKMALATHGNSMLGESSNRLRRAVRLHRTALSANSSENQLIDLWAALEGLVAQPSRESQRIEFFASCLLPSLTLTYPEKLLNSALRDLTSLIPKSIGVLDSVSGNDSRLSKFLRVLMCSSQATQRANIIDCSKSNPLLLNKLWRLSEQFKTRASTQITLRHHRQKVRWHLSRIYHTRNSIMHNATSLPYLSTLVENLHGYVDTLITSICRTAEISPEKLSIEAALQYLSSWETFRLHHLTHDGSENDAPLNDDDVWSVVFGNDMALAPSPTKEI